MKVIIPVAGKGTRLRPQTLTTPKVLLNVGGKPILDHLLNSLIQQDIDEFSLIIGHLGDSIRKHVEQNYPGKGKFYEQKNIQGIASAVYLAKEDLKENPVLIILGDTLFDADIAAYCRSENNSLGVYEVEDPRRFGVAEIDQDGFISKLIEKPENPSTNLALVGMYYFKKGRLLREAIEELFEKDIQTKGEYQITDAMQLMIEKGEKFSPFKINGWYDCGKIETTLDTNRHVLDTNKNNYSNTGNNIINPPVYISDSADISDSEIGPYVSIGDKTIIQKSKIKNTITGSGSIISESEIYNSLLGNNINIKGNFNNSSIGDYSVIIQNSS